MIEIYEKGKQQFNKPFLIVDNTNRIEKKSEDQKGETDLKIKGITIHKNKTCNTWYARPKVDGKQIYVSAKTQKLCYDKVKTILDKKAKIDIKTTTEKNTKSIMTLIEWYNKWLSLFKTDVKQGTIKNYNTCLNHIKEIHNKTAEVSRFVDEIKRDSR